ncbi:unnamed protein product [Adineta steineri]|uniref:Sushi domain-containing protein n=1 Tax=Adineta steineri TaxID=433720 RepID=A0A814HX28_9BILA|nr:unnamed protein product [Adineta steineri]CAF3979756.1 unnamed protein product [Adineta steineri]
MKVSSAAVFYAFLQITNLFIDVYGQCAWQDNAFPIIPYSYMFNADNLTLYTYGLAYGYYDIGCERGYAPDPTFGTRITCLSSGSWSMPLPICKSTGRCSVSQLTDFMGGSNGIIEIILNSSFIYTDGVDESKAMGGSNITFQCSQNSQNVGGPLTVVCNDDNNWTPFPNCISTGPVATPVPAQGRCPVNDDIWTFPNGYISSDTLPVVYSDNTTPSNVTVMCTRGYQMDSLSQGAYICHNGVWSARPYCEKTARCSLARLKDYISNPSLVSNLNVKAQQLATDMSGTDDEMLPDSYLTMVCIDQYVHTDGDLNITCNDDGSWSRFPSCTNMNAIQSTSNTPI